mgnify:CR=1 FL=1
MTFEEKASLFLYFGYLPVFDSNWDECPWMKKAPTSKNEHSMMNEADLILEGIKSWKNSIKNCITENESYIVPLSGGLDSRAILAELLELGFKDKITTVTYGSPGTWDFDIGTGIADKLKLDHCSIDLNRILIDRDKLKQALHSGGEWTDLFTTYFNKMIPLKFGHESLYWTGYMGDPISGSHLSKRDSKTLNEAWERFVDRNKMSVSYKVAKRDIIMKCINIDQLMQPQSISYDEMFDFQVRQQSYIKRVVTTGGYRFACPFIQAHWVNYMVNIPRNYRTDQRLYRRILLKAYPELFSYPTKFLKGLPLNAAHVKILNNKIEYKVGRAIEKLTGLKRMNRNMNYIDFDDAFRNRKDYNQLGCEMLTSLQARKVLNFKPLDIWDSHLKRNKSHQDIIRLMISLEIMTQEGY